jgi:tetratricopeptide (TPR) repeat protein
MPALAVFVATALCWGGWAWWNHWRYRTAIADIESQIAAGRTAIAARELTKLLAWKPHSDKAGYLLGTCEQARGRPQAAEDAFARVALGSAFWYEAIVARLRLFHDNGRLTAAEQLIEGAAEASRDDRTSLRVLLVPIYSEEGRLDEAERLIEDQWAHLNAAGEGATEPAIKLIRLHIELTFKPVPVETVRSLLDRRLALAPDDDRVWLGQANLAIRTGAYEEAGRLLDACLKRRPQDLPVWRARLSWGIAADRMDVVKDAIVHLPAAESNPAKLHRLNAWLALKRGDLETERTELECLLAADPADRQALARLAQMAEKDGQFARAGELTRQQAEVERLKAQYMRLDGRNQPFRDSARMARLAEQLGRRFEARAFITVAISEHPDRADLRADLARLSRGRATAAMHGRTLAEALGQETSAD